MEVRSLERHEVADVWSIDRSETIRGHYRLEEGRLVLEPAPFEVQGWPPGEREKYEPILLSCFDRGGAFRGVFHAGALIAAAVLDNVFLGTRRDRLQLEFLHVSRAHRGSGLGRMLFGEMIDRARELGARQIYVSATPTDNTIDFYLRRGCRPTDDVDETLFAREPEDIHLECDVTG